MFVDEKAVGEKEPVKVGKLKLSEAIRIGAKRHPQSYEYEWDEGKTCAMGAAAIGVGLGYGSRIGMQWACRTFPGISVRLVQEITNQNDSGMSREAIADWLESQGY